MAAAVPSRDPAARLGGRPADRDPLGPARLRAPLRARRPRGMWLPETAVDLATPAAHGRGGHPLHDPRPVAGPGRPPRHAAALPGRAGRRTITWSWPCTTPALSAAVSFEPSATADADRFARERLAAPLRGPIRCRTTSQPLVLIATDGELYGHHQPFRELFLRRLVRPAAGRAGHGFDVGLAGRRAGRAGGRPFRPIRIAERTSWSCHHGVLRWSGDCACAADATWKAPLRARPRTARGGDRRRHRAPRARPARAARPVGGP